MSADDNLRDALIEAFKPHHDCSWENGADWHTINLSAEAAADIALKVIKDRTALTIEVTEEMIEAGASVFEKWSEYWSVETMVAEAFRQMLAIARPEFSADSL